MIVKNRDIPIYLMQLQSLDRRLPPEHSRKEKVEVARIKELTGLNGEKKVDFQLSFLDETSYQILHQLRLQDNQGYFQIDSLIVHKNFFLILEIKNWFGKILFSANGQVTRVNEQEQEEGFPNPILQAKLQQHRFQKWLHKHHHTNLPIIFFVVIANPRTIIKQASKEEVIPQNVIHNNQLLFEIKKLEERYSVSYLSSKQIQTITQLLKKAHVPRYEDVLKKFKIDKDELIKGISCPKCQVIGMTRIYNKWLCPFCQHESYDAHIEAINDYLLLINNKVTNRQMREFLLVDSPSVIKYLLKKESHSYYGNTKARYYKLTLKNQIKY